MSSSIRLDALMAERALVRSRSQAADLIRRGAVRAAGELVLKPGRRVRCDIELEIEASAQPYVSRGGLKLAAALDHFAIDVSGARALDLGASTGGFTDVLLRRGAVHVTALDTGHGQLHESLSADPRVLNIEKLNARHLSSAHLAGPIDLISCDVSFISVRLALPPALALAEPGARLIALIKPQFEAGREHIGKGGIVRSADVRERVCDEISLWLAAQTHWRVLGLAPSPITGPDGNVEFLVAGVKDLR